MDAADNGPVFSERLTEALAPDAYKLGCIPLGVAAVCGVFGAQGLALAFLAVAVFVGFFFRNPERILTGDEFTVVAPADGRVVAVGEVEDADGAKAVRVGIFLSIFNVHINRAPVSGRVVGIERGGSEYLAAFNADAESRNVRCAMRLETASGAAVKVTQITGLVARRIVCQPRVGEWLRRGDRYGLIRFGSRTDVVLPLDSELRVVPGDRVRGGSSVIAVLRGGQE
ncbi:MAG: phosphatidylserine decarboxylase [Proteobacteria bacterium]|nr:phosphatidylserine decarboxylase [Pseudomonadota bacterium]